jgi:hypothetical protein
MSCRTALIVLLGSAAVACGGDSTAPGDSTPPADSIVSIEVTPGTATMEVGETLQLTAVARHASGRTVGAASATWSSNDETVAIVSTAGLVAAVGGGAATVTASHQGYSGHAQVTVRAPCQVTGLTVTPAEFTVAMGATVTLTATPTQQNCEEVALEWSSENPGIAEVSEVGVVTGVWPGSADITVNVEGTTLVAVSRATVRPPYPEGRITFTHLPMDAELSTGFIGLGNLNVLPEDHGAFLTSPEAVGQPATIPVYAPADGWIEGLIYDSLAWGRDLSMRIRYSTTVWTNYGHLSDFAPDIWTASGLLDKGFGDYRVYIPVSAGQIVAYTGEQVWGFDFYVGDDDLELGLISPSRYPYPWTKAGYPYDYFDEPQLSQLKALTIRQDEPRAGKVDYDIPGRIIGNWFLEGAEGWGGEPAQLAIVYDFIDGTRIAIADGSTRVDGSSEAQVYWVEGNAPRPEQVGVGYGLVKYEIRWRWFRDQYRSHGWSDVLGTFLVEMTEAGKIRVEKVLGKRADEVTGFSEAARTYVR